MSATSAAYKNVIGGKLKLKRPASTASSGAASSRQQAARPAASISSAATTTVRSSQRGDEGREEEEQAEEREAAGEKRRKTEVVQQAEDGKTKAQRDFERAQADREADVIRKKISKSHRQAIEEYNAKLASLSEHHDIPRVGPG